jgi:hypothetical protein
MHQLVLGGLAHASINFRVSLDPASVGFIMAAIGRKIKY